MGPCVVSHRDRHPARIERSPMADGRRRRYLYASGPGCCSGNMLRDARSHKIQHRTDERTDAVLALCASTHRTAPHARTHARTRITVPWQCQTHKMAISRRRVRFFERTNVAEIARSTRQRTRCRRGESAEQSEVSRGCARLSRYHEMHRLYYFLVSNISLA